MAFTRCGVPTLLIALACLSCQRSEVPEPSMTAGHTVIGAAEAAHKISWKLSAAFQTGNPAAFVDIVRGTTPALLDSLLQRRTEQALLDRALNAADSQAFAAAKLNLFTYALAYHPVYLLVPGQNPVSELDSARLRAVLSGDIGNWRDVGGPDLPISVFIPPLAGGAMHSLLHYFGGLPSVAAESFGTADSLLAAARTDPGALLVWPWPLGGLPWKPLSFGPKAAASFPDAASIMEHPGYPFRLDLTYATTRNKVDVAAGFLTFLMSNTGQREYMNLGYRPAAVPVRIVRLTKG
jgi:phosphate transport system substrate-binding protein